MAAEDRLRWDQIYRQRRTRAYLPPDPLLLNYTPPINGDEKRRALDLAGGIGQNGLWLAGQGYITDVMDISRIALTRARVEVTMRNLRNVNLLQVDLDASDVKDGHYDVLCVFRYLKRSLWKSIKAAVVPGGRVIYESFNVNYLAMVPEFNADYLLQPGELSEVFSLWNILHEDEASHVSQIVAVKPQGDLPPAEQADIDIDTPNLNW